MRGLTTTIGLAVILVGLGAYIYFVDSKRPASGAPEVKAKVFTAEADQIEEIRFMPKGGAASRADKTTGTWQLVEPEKADADQGQLSNAASSLASLEMTSELKFRSAISRSDLSRVLSLSADSCSCRAMSSRLRTTSICRAS